MKIIIIGAGKVGYSLAKQLSKENYSVTVIDSSEDTIDYINSNLDVFAIHGNGANFEVQKQADVGHANLVIAATDLDEVNMLTCIVAKKLGAQHTIARVRNPDYVKQVVFLQEELGLSLWINPEQATAEEISRVLRFPSATKVDSFAKGKAEIVEFRLSEGNPLCGMTISSIHPTYKVKVLISIVERDGQVFIPKGDFVLRSGDKISVVGSSFEQNRFANLIGIRKKPVKKVIIVGAGKIAVYLAEMLVKMGLKVKILERNYEKCVAIKNMLPKVTVACCDGTRPDILQEEGIRDTDALVALTGSDESNIITSVYAKSIGVEVVIAKVNGSQFDLVLNKTGVDITVQTSQITVQRITHYVRAMGNRKGSKMETLYLLNDGKAEAMQFNISASDAPNGLIKDMKIRKGVLVSAILRDGKCLIPGGNDRIQANDAVIIVTRHHDIREFGDIFER